MKLDMRKIFIRWTTNADARSVCGTTFLFYSNTVYFLCVCYVNLVQSPDNYNRWPVWRVPIAFLVAVSYIYKRITFSFSQIKYDWLSDWLIDWLKLEDTWTDIHNFYGTLYIEEVILHLVETKYFTILLYGLDCYPFNTADTRSLDFEAHTFFNENV